MRIGLIGTDARLDTCATLAQEDGHTVLRLGEEKELASFLSSIDFLLLPTPATRDGIHIAGTSLPLEALKGTSLPMLGGFLPERFPCPAYDLAKDETFLLKNAALTAEGGIAAALSATGRGFYGSSVGVIGFGRIAKFLCQKLSGFGIPLTIYARRPEARTEAALLGFRARPLKEDTVFEEDILFGTVPARIFEKTKVHTPRYICDLGGGMPSELKSTRGNAENAYPVTACRGVPGVFSPTAAGEIIYECLKHRLSIL